ncbi:MAG: anti-sigma factor [Anaerolineaceae bacterium]|jgi:anti-sigma-K factor RskA
MYHAMGYQMVDEGKMADEHILDLLPGYALGALDDEDLLKTARHLPHCTACLREFEAYLSVKDQLAFLIPSRSPDYSLKARVLKKVEAESRQAGHARSLPAAAPAVFRSTTGWHRLRLLFGRSKSLVFAALLLALIVLLGLNNYLLWQQFTQAQALLPGERVMIARLDGTSQAPDAIGYVIIFRNNKYGSLTVENAPVLGENQQYQVWLIRNGERVSGGLFSVNAAGYGVLQIYSHEPLDRYEAFGITIEPAGGSPAPTGEKILGGNL